MSTQGTRPLQPLDPHPTAGCLTTFITVDHPRPSVASRIGAPLPLPTFVPPFWETPVLPAVTALSTGVGAAGGTLVGAAISGETGGKSQKPLDARASEQATSALLQQSEQGDPRTPARASAASPPSVGAVGATTATTTATTNSAVVLAQTDNNGGSGGSSSTGEAAADSDAGPSLLPLATVSAALDPTWLPTLEHMQRSATSSLTVCHPLFFSPSLDCYSLSFHSLLLY
jgi:hypothetical protein